MLTWRATARVLLAAILLMGCARFASAQTRVVRVAAFETETDFVSDGSGGYDGYTAAYLDDIAYFAGWAYEYVPCAPSDAYAYALDGAVDLIPMVVKTPERAQRYLFAQSAYGETSAALFTRADSGLDSLNFADRPLAIAVASGTRDADDLESYAAQRGFSYTPVYCESPEAVREAVSEGRADAGVFGDSQSVEGMKPVARFAASPYYFVSAPDNQALMDELDDAMRSIRFAMPDHDRLLAAHYDKSDLNMASFTNEELAYLRGAGTLRVAYTPFWSPLCDTDADGRARGILVDILRAAFEEASLSVEFVPCEDKTAVLETVFAGGADMLAGFVGSDEYAARLGLAASAPMLDVSLLQIVDPDGGDAPYYAATYLPDDQLLPGTEDLTPRLFDDAQACLEALRKGEVSKAYVNSYSANALLSKDRYARLEALPFSGAQARVRLAFPADCDPRLVSIVNKLLGALDDSEVNDIIVRGALTETDMSLAALIRANPMGMLTALGVTFALAVVAILYAASLRMRKREREQNRRLQAALEAAQKASEAKGSFMSRMSHEIRTPLNAVIGYNSIARDALAQAKDEITRRQADMKVLDCLTKNDIASKHLLTIINDVLDMSAIESGNIKRARERFDFKTMITSLTVLFYAQAKAKKVRFEVVFETPTDEWFTGDQMRVNQILTNLLSNAVKFTAKGEVRLAIRQDEAADGAPVMRFAVTDTGIGMDQAYVDHIWTPFEQADATISRRFGGTGLGLSITKSLVELLGGEIEVQSRKGAGTTFRVTLPFETADQGERNMSYDFSSLHALVVDDDRSACEYMKLLFDRCRVRCETATSGRDALAEIERAKASGDSFNLCLMDWRMPELDGVETVRRLKDVAGGGMPVVIVTAYDFAEIEDDARAEGVTTFVSKPLFQSTLFNLLVNVSGRSLDAGGAQSEEFDFAGARVLLAEDNEMNMEIAKAVLATAGIEADSAWNGKEAVAMFESAPPGTYKAILMDVQMPEMDGHEASRVIRASAHSEAKTIPIIAMTADAFAQNVQDALAAGMNDHIAKPIDTDTLFQTLAKYLKNREE